jgi:hypothetical protein
MQKTGLGLDDLASSWPLSTHSQAGTVGVPGLVQVNIVVANRTLAIAAVRAVVGGSFAICTTREWSVVQINTRGRID